MNFILDNIKKSTIVVLIICGATVVFHWVSYGDISWKNLRMPLFYNVYYGFPIFFVNTLPSFIRERFATPESTRNHGKWFVLSFLMGITFTMITMIGLNYILWVLINGHPTSVVLARHNSSFYVQAFIITVIVSLFFYAYFFYKKIIEDNIQLERLHKEKLKFEHNALKAHIDPHFLFNSFNVLSGLMDEDVDKAQDFLAGLSKVYRYVLEQKEHETNTLQEELAFAQTYMNLYQTRFEHSIQLTIDVPKSLQQQKVVSLSLQLLLENAVKHNALSPQNPLCVDITIVDNYLVVQNNKTPKKILPHSNKTGLQNIKDRYLLVGEQAVDIIDTSTNFTVKLPLLP